MGILTLVTIDQFESQRVQNWFPCLTTTITTLDRHLLSKLYSSPFDVDLTFAEVTCLLRWFNSIPSGLVSESDKRLAERLAHPLSGLMSRS